MKAKISRIGIGVLLGTLICALVLVGCSSSKEDSSTGETSSSQQKASSVELQLFAANSLKDAMNEVQQIYTEQTGITFADTQYEASGTLIEMLGGGAPCDGLITASSSTMKDAEEKGYVDPETTFNMFTNELVIVTGPDSGIASATLEDISSGNYTLAVGDANVPAGNYAKQSLSTTVPPSWISADGNVGPECSGKDGTFDGTPLEGKVTEGSSVGNVCSYANTGDVQLAMVYSSDVFRFKNVTQIGIAPEDTHKPIIYPAAVCANASYPAETQAFLEWAFSNEDAIKVWQSWGFELAEQ